MSLAKNYPKNSSKCRVTFKIPKDVAENAEQASVVGDFNGWDASAAQMKKLKTGCFSLTLSLPVGATYQFRYLLNDDSWMSDSEADGYAYCTYGNCENSILTV